MYGEAFLAFEKLSCYINITGRIAPIMVTFKRSVGGLVITSYDLVK